MNRRARILVLAALALAASCRAEPWVEVGGERFRVEVAYTMQEQARGLMFRKRLADHKGMLFVYERPRPQRFWMKNTRIPLDILYFDGERRLLNVHTAPPCETDPCATYPSSGPAQYVLELNAGKSEELGLEPGVEMVLSPELR